MTTSRTAVAALLGLGALTYSAWALEAVLTTDLAPAHTYVSELAARNQPHGSLFRTTDLLAGTLVWAAGLLASLRPPFPGRWTRAGWVALVLFGTATAVDSACHSAAHPPRTRRAPHRSARACCRWPIPRTP